ncbi:MAG: AI-2E family transporter, partial [Planctomycetota bacterium]
MLERLSKNHRNIALAGIALLALWFAWTVRAVLNPLILGYLLAYILRPSVRRLERGGMRRRTAVNVIFALFGLALLGIGGGVFVQGRQFVENQARLIDEGELREQLDHIRSLSLSRGESTWMRGNTFYGKRQMFSSEFMD